jgi:hypothetical protein
LEQDGRNGAADVIKRGELLHAGKSCAPAAYGTTSAALDVTWTHHWLSGHDAEDPQAAAEAAIVVAEPSSPFTLIC